MNPWVSVHITCPFIENQPKNIHKPHSPSTVSKAPCLTTISSTTLLQCFAQLRYLQHNPLVNEFLTEAFGASELKDVGCTHIAIFVDTTDIAQLTEPSRPPVKEYLQYPFLNWKLDELVNFARQFDRTAHGIIDTEFVMLDGKNSQRQDFCTCHAV
ncbi:hypothetical protein PTTW11_07581 [Pyrenophora teres f. teres]|uniref:Uncharacterized protein n=1 Tax=Pyrenophora teres f. teres TaxID=97479 RepID=A0A6S6W5X3_9PLEO|nr:hypothetical protein PTTW11_07581 [Pyrenophora teres f. teres]